MIDARLSLIRRVAGSDKAKTNRCRLSSFDSSEIIRLHILYLCRAFKTILMNDRATYGVGEDYEIGDLINNEWQQRVDDVVAGILEQQGA